MLHKLTISNYALIDNLDIQFPQGMATITGETGAGKSIMLGALSLLLGKRADTSVLKDNEKKSVIEASFKLPKDLKDFFEKQDLDFETETIIRREITPQGKSRSFINDTPVSLQTLKDLGNILIDIHSQHQNLFLKESSFQCQVLDAEAGNEELLTEFRKELSLLEDIGQKLSNFQEEVRKKQADLEYYKYRLDEITNLNVKPGELVELEQESALIEHSEGIKTMFGQADEMFNGENAILSQIKSSLQNFERNASYTTKIEEIRERLSQSYIELLDIASEVAKYNEKLDFDPQRKEEIDARLGLLYSMLKKYAVQSEEDLLEEKQKMQEWVDAIENADSYNEELEKQYQAQKAIVSALAQELHQRREKAIQRLCPEIVSLLQKLGMPSVQFNISLLPLQNYGRNGSEDVKMEFSANKNIEPQWLGEISSGGELSRVMLCLKYILARNKSVQTIIFDEIDTGVSGEIADQMGNMMLAMAKDMQVITITHLPQIAVKAQTQYKVFKTETDDTTTSNIQQLSQNERIEEIAKMLSGKIVTEAALNNARMLLNY